MTYSQTTFNSLPPELYLYIARFLSSQHIRNLSQTSTKFYSIYQDLKDCSCQFSYNRSILRTCSNGQQNQSNWLVNNKIRSLFICANELLRLPSYPFVLKCFPNLDKVVVNGDLYLTPLLNCGVLQFAKAYHIKVQGSLRVSVDPSLTNAETANANILQVVELDFPCPFSCKMLDHLDLSALKTLRFSLHQISHRFIFIVNTVSSVTQVYISAYVVVDESNRVAIDDGFFDLKLMRYHNLKTCHISFTRIGLESPSVLYIPQGTSKFAVPAITSLDTTCLDNDEACAILRSISFPRLELLNTSWLCLAYASSPAVVDHLTTIQLVFGSECEPVVDLVGICDVLPRLLCLRKVRLALKLTSQHKKCRLIEDCARVFRLCDIADEISEALHSVVNAHYLHSTPPVINSLYCAISEAFLLSQKNVGKAVCRVYQDLQDEALAGVLGPVRSFEAVLKVLQQVPTLKYLSIKADCHMFFSPQLEQLVKTHSSLQQVFLDLALVYFEGSGQDVSPPRQLYLNRTYEDVFPRVSYIYTNFSSSQAVQCVVDVHRKRHFSVAVIKQYGLLDLPLNEDFLDTSNNEEFNGWI